MKITLFLLLFYSANGFAFDQNYSALAEVLGKYTENGKVDYAALKNNRTALDAFIKEYSEVSFEQYSFYSRNQRMAFVINLYNAAALQLIINNYPVETIKDIGGFFSSPWNVKFVKLFDHTVGLGHIEHDILRDFQDPRIHFAIVSATKGNPILRSTPYLADSLNEQLEEAEQKFMTERQKINFFDGKTLHLAAMFDWFRLDFGGKNGIIAFAKKYFPEINNATDIEYSSFDWSLNKK